MKRQLFLHIGHGKTGSSFLQTCFANSIDRLFAAGIDYPIDPDTLAKARSGQTTMGNFPPSTRYDGHDIGVLIDLVRGLPKDRGQNVLISNEGLFQSIVLREFMALIDSAFPNYELRLLLLIRDPLDHIISSYQEMLKVDGIGDIEDLMKITSTPQNVSKALERATHSGARVEVVNFSRHRSALKGIAEGWMGLPEGTLQAGPVPVVNRSMDRSEILIQRAFNRQVGSYARTFVADALTAELPDIMPRKPSIDHAVLADFLQRMNRDILPVNARIPEGEHYRVPSFEEAIASIPDREEGNTIQISLEQLDVLAANIAKHLPAKWRKVRPEGSSG